MRREPVEPRSCRPCRPRSRSLRDLRSPLPRTVRFRARGVVGCAAQPLRVAGMRSARSADGRESATQGRNCLQTWSAPEVCEVCEVCASTASGEPDYQVEGHGSDVAVPRAWLLSIQSGGRGPRRRALLPPRSFMVPTRRCPRARMWRRKSRNGKVRPARGVADAHGSPERQPGAGVDVSAPAVPRRALLSYR